MKRAKSTNGLTTIKVIAASAVFFGLVSPIVSPFASARIHSYLSALPLALAGISYGLLQLRSRLSRQVLLRRLVLAGAFVGWAVDELLPSGPGAVVLGDVVIVGFVLDVMLLIRDQIQDDSPAARRSSSPASPARSDRFNLPVDMDDNSRTVTSWRE